MSTSNAALEIILSANLSPTEHLLLKGFTEEAVDPELAARYLISRISHDGQRGIEASLRSFKNEWRKLVMRMTACDPVSQRLATLARLRDGPYCALTKNSRSSRVANTEPAYIIPPSMFHNLETEEEGRLFMMLEAHISPIYVKKLQMQLAGQESNDESSLRNLWVLSPSVHRAFREGHVAVELSYQPSGNPTPNELDEKSSDAWYELDTMYPEEITGLFLGDGTPFERTVRFRFTPDAEALPRPSPLLFGIHRRLANALHLFYIEDKIACGWPQLSRDPLGFHIPVLRNIFHSLWLHIPLRLRLRCYMLLKDFGRWFYGPTIASCVHQLPFGLILKQCDRSRQNEPTSLRLVEQYTSIPAPRVIDVGEYNNKTYLVMTRVRGQMLHEVLHLMSYAERDLFANDLRSCVAQLREIPNLTPFLFCNTLGGPIYDHRIPGGTGGPFNSESDFNNYLTSHLGCTLAEALGEENVIQNHRSYFTHSDFHPTNLLVYRGRLSGIVDWECAGYMPEYWEFTKAIYGTRQKPILENLFQRAFKHQYETELEVERKLWRYTPFGV